MQVSVEKVNNIERRLTITVPANQIEEAFNKRLAQYAQKANIKGFRPGKAPMSHITQQFGKDAWQEAWSEVIQKSLYEALENNQLRPINTPKIEPKSMLPNQPLEFVASFEVLPEFGKINAALGNIEKPIAEIKENDINEVIEKLRKQHTNWRVVERAAKDSDRIIIDHYPIFEGKVEEENTVKDFPLELGGKRMLPGFEEGLVGVKAGDERTLHLTFPDKFPITDRAGKPVDFVVTVKQVYEADMPALDETFIKKLGVATGLETDLHEQIRQTLKQDCDRLINEKMKDQVFQQLLEQNPLEVPESLVQREAGRIHDEVYPQHQDHAHHQHSEDELTSFKDIARKRVSLGLLIGEFIKQEKLVANKERVQKRIEEIAAVYERPQEVINWLSSKERIADIEAQVLEDEVMDKLLESATVVEKGMTYAELKGTH